MPLVDEWVYVGEYPDSEEGEYALFCALQDYHRENGWIPQDSILEMVACCDGCQRATVGVHLRMVDETQLLYCPECGPRSEMRCLRCGAETTDEKVFCDECS